MAQLHSKVFKNDFVNTFPGDASGDTTPRQTPGVLYSRTPPTPVAKPQLIGWSYELAAKLALEHPDATDIDILGGNKVAESMIPYSACYAGHQFGTWAGQLGDGRAITLGELDAIDGGFQEVQLKGAGRTAYSRRADGRAVLRSSVREFLMSEAMHHLGIPTTRALSLVSTGDPVLRDMFYNGNPEYEPGAIVARVAPSFLRFGNFEMLAARKEIDNLSRLVNWTISRFYPEINGKDKILQWFGEVVERTANLVVEWLRVGFVHGVMNTDNMSVLGLTIDYGPFSFVDNFDLNFTPNTTDLPGRRYAFGKQAEISYWNLGCLASAIAPLLPDTKELIEVLEGFQNQFWSSYYEMMGRKLGLGSLEESDAGLIAKLEDFLQLVQPDMTIFYQLLIDFPDTATKEELVAYFEPSFYDHPNSQESEDLFQLMKLYENRLSHNSIGREESKRLMKATNPRFILRNYLLHLAIEELQNGKNELFVKVQQALKTPYSNAHDEFFQRRPQWAEQQAGCSMLSCSS